MIVTATIPQYSKPASVRIVQDISRDEFYRSYVRQRKSVVIRGVTRGWDAISKWDAGYFGNIGAGLRVPIKTGNVAEGQRINMPLNEYTAGLAHFENELLSGRQPEQRPAYLHDIPIFHLLPALKKDVEPFPLKYFPKWYWKEWWNYVQFFMGSTGSYTPLHFDTLYTHNLFFQVTGKKRFLVIEPAYKDQSYIYSWRWSRVDARHADFGKFPLFRDVEVSEAILEPGDILYLPAGTLHQVHGLSFSISFNIDWHTAGSVRKGLFSFLQGAPSKNIYYNFLLSLGIYFNVPSRYIFPYYKSYLNYIS